MFKILEKKNPDPQDIVKNIREAETALSQQTELLTRVENELSDLYQRELSGGPVKAIDIRKKEDQLTRVRGRVTACRKGIDALKEQLQATIVGQRDRKIADLKTRLTELKDEYAAGIEKVARMYAQAAIEDMKIRNRSTTIPQNLSGDAARVFLDIMEKANLSPRDSVEYRMQSTYEQIKALETDSGFDPDIESACLLESA